MHRRFWLWLVIAACPAPFFFNCHSATDLRFAEANQQDSISAPPADDNSPVQAFLDQLPKVDLDPSTLTTGSSISANGSFNAKASSADESIVPRGLRLFALVDNDCLAAKHAQSQGSKKGSAPSFSEKASEVAGGPVDGLKLQAYAFETLDARPLSEFTQEAEDDECVVRVANDKKMQVLPPGPTEPAAIETQSTAPVNGKASTLIATNDPNALAQKHLTAIKARQGWNVFFNGTRGIQRDVTVAVVDTGITYDHTDLRANMWTDSQGRFGRDFENMDNDPIDDNGHGTHVAGLIGAVSDNGVGVSGVMGKHIKLMAVKVADAQGGAYPSVILNGVRWAVDNGAEVINISIGYPDSNVDLMQALMYASSKGVVVVVAAGNDGHQLNSTTITAPANYASAIAGTIAVGSTDSATGAKSDFSNYSPTLVQITAPGSNGIWSTFPGGYQAMQGTSMASPIVAGSAALVVGLLKSETGSFNNTEVINILKVTARPEPNLAPYFANGAALDLERLGRYMKSRFQTTTDGGTESPF